MTDSDPTLVALAKFQDPGHWERIEKSVPVFRPHRRKAKQKDAAGKPVEILIDVDLERLHRIAANINAREKASGTLPVLTLGHRLPANGPDGNPTPQSQQPPLLGFARNARVQPFGPSGQQALVWDEYYLKGKGGLVSGHPFRSAEFYADADEITGCARLLNDPQLDMGLVYQGERGQVIHYAMGADAMPDPTESPKPSDLEAQDEEKAKGAEAFKQGMQEHYPHLHGLHEHMAKTGSPLNYNCAAAGGAPGAPGSPPAFPGPTNGGPPMPEEHKKEEKKQEYAGTEEAIRYARMEAEIAQLKKDNEETRLNYARATAQNTVDELERAGYLFRDKAKEVERMAPMTADQRKERVEEIVQHYQRDPTAGRMVSPFTTDGLERDRGESPLTEYQLEKALDYQRDQESLGKSVPWEECEAFARNGKAVKKTS